jgi:hypothetical protein
MTIQGLGQPRLVVVCITETVMHVYNVDTKALLLELADHKKLISQVIFSLE